MNLAIKKYTVNDIINYLLIIYTFSIPFDKGVTKVLGLLLILLWLFDKNLLDRIKTIFTSKVILFFTLFIIYNYISLFWTNHLEYAYYYVSKYFYYLPIIVIFTSIKKEYIKYLVYTFLVAMFVSEIITYGIYFELWSTKYNDLKNISSPTAFMSHTIYSAILALAALITFYKLFTVKNHFFLILGIVFYISVTINLFISGGRTGILPFILGHFFIVMIIYKLRFLSILSILFVFFTFLYISYLNVNFFKQRIDQGYNNINSIIENKNFTTPIGTRIAMIYIGLEITKDNLVFGVGIKDNMDKMLEYAKDNKVLEYTKDNKDFNFKHLKTFYKWHFHNQYIEITTQIGLIGLILFLSIFYTLTRTEIRDKEINSIKYIFVFTFLFSIVSSDLFHQKHYIYVVGLFIGLILAQNRYEKLEEER